jgi:predicted amidohydrolase
LRPHVKAAAVQMAPEWLQPARNAERICTFLRQAGDAGADLVVFPELVSTGYVTRRDRDFMAEYLEASVDVPGPFTEQVGAAVRSIGCFAVVGVARRHPTIPGCMFNSSLVFDPAGRIVAVYDKTHIPAEEKHYFFEGGRLDVLRTSLGNLGALICADNSFPEAARVLTLQGAEILAVSYARPRIQPPMLYRYVVQTRAFENQCFVVAANRVGMEVRGTYELSFEGGTVIAGPTGEILAALEHEEEGIAYADLMQDDLASSRLWQTRFRDRRPELYDILPSHAVARQGPATGAGAPPVSEARVETNHVARQEIGDGASGGAVKI